MRNWRTWGTAIIVATLALGIVLHRHDLTDAVGQLGALPAPWVVGLSTLAVAATVASGLLACAVSPQLTLTRGVMVQQATLAANNTGVGSGPVALGVRVGMLRSWGLNEVEVGVAVLGVNVVGAWKLWLAALVTSGLALVAPGDDVVEPWVLWTIIGASTAVLVGTAAALWLVLRHPAPLRRLATIADRVVRRLAGRSQRLERVVRHLEPSTLLERFRTEASALARRRGGRIVAAGLLEQLLLAALSIAIVRAHGLDASVLPAHQIALVFVIVRLGASLTAVPGGIGVTEIGLLALLARTAAPDAAALATVLTYRAITFALPLVVGAVCLGVWRRTLGIGPEPVTEREPVIA